MAGGQVQRDPVLERRVGLVVEVDADVVLVERALEHVGVDPEGEVQDVVARAWPAMSIVLAVLGRAADEHHARVPVERPHVAVVAVGDGQRHRAPHRAARARRSRRSAGRRRRCGRSCRRRRRRARAADARGPGALPPRRGSGSVRKPTVSARAARRTPRRARSRAGRRRRRAARTSPARRAARRCRRPRGTRRTCRAGPRTSPSRAHARKNVDWPTKATRSGARREGSR